jgi:Ca2+-binding EF-hand superfamily protein
VFDLLNEDNTGKITLRNLKRFSRELCKTMTDDELQAMIDEFDLDHDFAISFQEFIAIMDSSQSF